MTKRSIALEAHRADIRTIVASNRATNVRIFGSVIRSEDDDASDLDVRVDASPGATLLDLGAIQIELEEMLGVAVDVLTPMDLPKKCRQEVLAEAVAV